MNRLIKFCPVLLLVLVVMSGCGGTKASDISSIEDMKGKKIGVQIGTTGDIYVSDYEGDKEGTKIERYNKGNDAISSLKNGKIDCVVIDSEPAKAFVAKNEDLSILKEPFALEEYAICISKEKNYNLEKASEELTDILVKYNYS